MHTMKNKQNSKGFTLVELAVCFVILLLLISIGIVGIFAYQDFADFKRQNSYAQTLFVAAQSQLTGYSVRGQMEELKAAAEGSLDIDTIITPSGKPAGKSNLYFLTGTKEAYVHYLAGEYQGKSDKISRSYQALYDIFDQYIYDKSILTACISIEFDPEEGVVYGVLYSDKNASFTYTQKNKPGRVNICNRQEDYRSEYMIGYYGLD